MSRLLLVSLGSKVQIVLLGDYVIINTQANTNLKIIWHFLRIIKIMTDIYKVLTLHKTNTVPSALYVLIHVALITIL